MNASFMYPLFSGLLGSSCQTFFCQLKGFSYPLKAFSKSSPRDENDGDFDMNTTKTTVLFSPRDENDGDFDMNTAKTTVLFSPRDENDGDFDMNTAKTTVLFSPRGENDGDFDKNYSTIYP